MIENLLLKSFVHEIIRMLNNHFHQIYGFCQIKLHWYSTSSCVPSQAATKALSAQRWEADGQEWTWQEVTTLQKTKPSLNMMGLKLLTTYKIEELVTPLPEICVYRFLRLDIEWIRISHPRPWCCPSHSSWKKWVKRKGEHAGTHSSRL